MGQKTETKKPDPEGVYWIHIELDVKGKSKRSCSRGADPGRKDDEYDRKSDLWRVLRWKKGRPLRRIADAG